ncbi:MAG: hypothetical protein KatS3mg110_3688 [Pirellulaceae bacterium]|nr:MAG: hypothetical protein KatS3mg110_3688 [Pirellulaceae bacterium]
MNDTSWAIRRERNVLVVQVTGPLGEFDRRLVEQFTQEVQNALQGQTGASLVVDLGDCTLLGSGALGALIRLRNEVVASGGRAALSGATGPILTIVRTVRLDRMWELYDTVDAALCALSPAT